MSTTLVDGSTRGFRGETRCWALKEDIKCCDGSQDGIEAEARQTKAIRNPVVRTDPSSRKVEDFPTSRTGTTSSGLGRQHSRRGQHRGRNLQKTARAGALHRPPSAPKHPFSSNRRQMARPLLAEPEAGGRKERAHEFGESYAPVSTTTLPWVLRGAET